MSSWETDCRTGILATLHSAGQDILCVESASPLHSHSNPISQKAAVYIVRGREG